jgi:hypothetical protein
MVIPEAALVIAIAAGQISVDEVVRTAVSAGSGPRLIANINAATSSSKLIQAVAAGAPPTELLNLPILPRPHGLEVLTMSRDNEHATVVSCANWAELRRAGFCPMTTYDIKEEALFKDAYATLRALELATPAATSFLRTIHLNTEAAAFLPASLLPCLSSDADAMIQRWTAESVSLLDLSRKEGVELEATGDGLSITWDGMSAYLHEILRADLDGDGLEDLVYSCYYRVNRGTFGAGNVGVLTRRSSCAMLEPISIAALYP